MSEIVLSPQEARIKEEIESKVISFKRHNRAGEILKEIRTQKPQIDVERGLYFTQSFKETEGEPLNVRWAKALYHYAKNASVYIDHNQLLVGRSGKPGRYGILYPELDGNVLHIAIEKLPKRKNSSFDITPEDAETVIHEIAPYWQGKTFHEDLAKALPKDTVRLTYNPDEELTSRYIVNETASFRSSLQWVHDYEIVLKKGFLGIKKDAEEHLKELDEYSPIDNMEKKPFWESVIITCDAIILWANRHGDLAEKLAKEEKNLKRKEELLRIARNCHHVPANPPKDFYEALQAQWFTQMFSRIEQKTGTIISNGRMDQYLYPFYKKDIEEGKITDEEVLELFECLWVSMAQFIDLYLSETGGAFNEGYAHWEAVTVGGQTKEGYDATNELTYLLLRSKREFPLNYPDLAARVHVRSPKRYLYEIAETIKQGEGFPKLINDEDVIPLLLSKGASFEEAYDYSVSGCAECRMPNRDTYTSPNAYINFAAALEMVLYNGRMKKYGDELLGIETGEFESFKTFDELLNAYFTQQRYFIKHAFIQQHAIIRLRTQHFATPLGSSLHALCRKYTIDLHQPEIPEGIDLGYFEFIGYATVIDSLIAIKKLVFDEKKLTLKQVKEAVSHNFEGYEAIRQLLLHAPSYGNNDPYADQLGKLLDKEAQDFTAKYGKELKVHMDLRLVPFTSHVPFGKVVSATPNGRYAYTPLSDGSSASQGADINGPTEILLSNYETKNFNQKDHAGRLLNIKLSPSCVKGEEGTKKLVQFIESWRDLKLWHVQFNVLNSETLREAQKHPENYKNLLVRIAGYSAYFTELTKDLQDDIILRTEHEAV